MKKILSLLLAILSCMSFFACGETESDSTNENVSVSETKAEVVVESESDTDTATKATEVTNEDTTPKVTEVVVEDTAPKATEAKIGEAISLDFVEITVKETGIQEDIRRSFTSGYFTTTIGPAPEAGKQFIYLNGTIKNLHTKELPVYDFFIGEFKLDDYAFECGATDCDIFNANGDLESSIDPLSTYDFTIYVAVPNELVNNYSTSSFRFGFYDLFDNAELAKNRAFEDDPISMCPYLYNITLK